MPFLTRDDFMRRILDAELVIVHAGAGTMLQAIRAAKVPVAMPRLSRFGEHVDDHQTELAAFLAASRRIVLAEEPANLLPAIRTALRLQRERRDHADAAREPALVALVRQALAELARAS
jgi:UDP-N-acetylglucosamine transferase subunit ALG13